MYNLPTSTLVNRVIPKKMFVDQLGANTQMKNHFTNDIVKVEWLAKLAPSTLNVADGNDVHEISVFQVPIKENDCPNDLFAFIDSMIPRHTIFILAKGDMVCLHLNYKERIESKGKTEKVFRITKTYRSPWMNSRLLSIQIEGLDMNAIYETLVRQVAGDKLTSQSNDLKRDVEESQEQVKLRKEIQTLKAKISAERQPQKKFILYKKLKDLENKQK